MIGVNCKFDPPESLKAVGKMKEGLEKAGLKAHLMFQPLGFHCPDADQKHGYLGLPEFPFGKIDIEISCSLILLLTLVLYVAALEPRQLTRWDVHKLTRKAYELGVRYFGGCCGFKAYHIRAISEEVSSATNFNTSSPSS